MMVEGVELDRIFWVTYISLKSGKIVNENEIRVLS